MFKRCNVNWPLTAITSENQSSVKSCHIEDFASWPQRFNFRYLNLTIFKTEFSLYIRKLECKISLMQNPKLQCSWTKVYFALIILNDHYYPSVYITGKSLQYKTELFYIQNVAIFPLLLLNVNNVTEKVVNAKENTKFSNTLKCILVLR